MHCQSHRIVPAIYTLTNLQETYETYTHEPTRDLQETSQPYTANHIESFPPYVHSRTYTRPRSHALPHTGWRRTTACLELHVIFHKRATNYRALLRKMTCKDKALYGSSPSFSQGNLTHESDVLISCIKEAHLYIYVHIHLCKYIYISTYICINTSRLCKFCSHQKSPLFSWITRAISSNQRAPCSLAKVPYILSKEPNILPKESYRVWKEACTLLL